MKERIYMASPTMHGEEQKFVQEAFDTNWIAPLGPNVNGFEREMEAYTGIAHCSALSAGTAALHLAVKLLEVGEGDTVICPSLTFAATANPVAYEKGKIVFVDSEPETWNMSPQALRRALEEHKEAKAVIVAHLYGTPAKVDEIKALCEEYKVPLIEDAAESLGATYKGVQTGRFGVMAGFSFNGNKMITTSGGGALICRNAEDVNQIMWYATQARDAYPYYQHTAIGFNYRMSNVCAGIGCGQMTVLDQHIAHHKHVQALYEDLMKDIPGVKINKQPNDPRYDSNYWLCTMTLEPSVKVKGQENAYKEVIKTAVGGAAGVVHQVDSPTTDCQPNDNVEAMRLFMLSKKVECRPVWKPMHKQPVYADAVVYTNGIEEDLFKIGMCLPAGPYVTDDDVRYIVDCIKEAIEL